jgi:hypothetical protein
MSFDFHNIFKSTIEYLDKAKLSIWNLINKIGMFKRKHSPKEWSRNHIEVKEAST